MQLLDSDSTATGNLGHLDGLIDFIANLLAEEKLKEIENNIEFNKEVFKHEEIGIIEPQPIRN